MELKTWLLLGLLLMFVGRGCEDVMSILGITRTILVINNPVVNVIDVAARLVRMLGGILLLVLFFIHFRRVISLGMCIYESTHDC